MNKSSIVFLKVFMPLLVFNAYSENLDIMYMKNAGFLSTGDHTGYFDSYRMNYYVSENLSFGAILDLLRFRETGFDSLGYPFSGWHDISKSSIGFMSNYSLFALGNRFKNSFGLGAGFGNEWFKTNISQQMLRSPVQEPWVLEEYKKGKFAEEQRLLILQSLDDRYIYFITDQREGTDTFALVSIYYLLRMPYIKFKIEGKGRFYAKDDFLWSAGIGFGAFLF